MDPNFDNIPIEVILNNIFTQLSGSNLAKLASTSRDFLNRIFDNSHVILQSILSQIDSNNKKIHFSGSNMPGNQLALVTYFHFYILDGNIHIPTQQTQNHMMMDMGWLDQLDMLMQPPPEQYINVGQNYQELERYIMEYYAHNIQAMFFVVTGLDWDQSQRIKMFFNLISFKKEIRPPQQPYVFPQGELVNVDPPAPLPFPDVLLFGGGQKSKQYVIYQNKPFLLRRDSKGKKYILVSKSKVFLSTIKGKYTYKK